MSRVIKYETAAGEDLTHTLKPPTLDQRAEALERDLHGHFLKEKESRRLHALMYGDEKSEQPAYDQEYGSASEADAALFCLIARGTRDPELIEHLARQSSRKREKWDKNRKYVARTIDWALDVTDRQYLAAHAPAAPEDGEPEALALRGYSDAEIQTMPEPVWLIDGVLPAGGLVEVVGRYGAGKTFLFIDWLMHVAGGITWQGRKVQRGPCLYVYGEGHMKPRVIAWRAAHGIAEASTVGVTYVPGNVNLLSEAAVTSFIEQVLSDTFGPKPVVIAFDTLSRMAPGDENSPEHGALVVAACERIQRATGAAVILGHHTPWNLDKQRPKGSSKVPDCADAVFLLENNDGALKLTCQKMRDAETAGVLYLKLSPVPPALVVDAGAAPPTPVDELTRLLKAEGPLTKGELQLRLGKSQRTVERLLNEAGTAVTTVTGTGVGKHAKYEARHPATPYKGGGVAWPAKARHGGGGGGDVATTEDLPF